MWLVKGAPNLMQRLSRLPSAPHLTLLDCRKPKPFPWPHITPPLESRLTSDGVASTYRMHLPYRTSSGFWPIPSLRLPRHTKNHKGVYDQTHGYDCPG